MTSKHHIVLELEMLPGAESQASATLQALAHAYLEDMACFELPGFKVLDLRVGNGQPQSRDTHVPKSQPLHRRDV